MWYLAACLAGLAAGLWPSTLYMPPSHPPQIPLPALGTLAVAQSLFFLVIYPLILLRRLARPGGMADFGECGRAATVRPHECGCWSYVVLESLVLLVTTVPFYFAAAFLSDSTWLDVLRIALAVACVVPLAWVAAMYLTWNNLARTLAMLGMLVVAVGLPAGIYLAHEFVGEQLADRLWQLAPATFALSNAAPHQSSLLPSPLWVLPTWPAIALGLFLLRMLLRRQSSDGGH